jgi:3-oxoacyl-[acyl-carrier protein] reductase
MSQPLFVGKTCLVTGASKGLGYRIARRFWSEGANLVLAVRDPQSVTSLFADMDRLANQFSVSLPLDLADLGSVRSLVQRTNESGVDRIDVLVNNAAVLGPIGKAWETSSKDWEAAITVDLTAPAIICNSVVPLMSRSASGKIINLSGGGASGPRSNFSAYAAAKSGLVRFSETLAEEVRELGICVNCVAPGPLGTDMLAAIEKAGAKIAGEKEYAAAQRARETGDATMNAAVDLVVFLASHHSDGVTGKLISAIWDNWQEFPQHLQEIANSDVYTLRRIIGRDRGIAWCDR